MLVQRTSNQASCRKLWTFLALVFIAATSIALRTWCRTTPVTISGLKQIASRPTRTGRFHCTVRACGGGQRLFDLAYWETKAQRP